MALKPNFYCIDNDKGIFGTAHKEVDGILGPVGFI